MIGIKTAIKAAERHIGEDASYMRDIAAVSGRAFWGFARFSRLAAYRKHTTKTLIHLARLGAMMGEDCGTCVRITVRLAKRDGADAGALKAGLAGGEDLRGSEAQAYFFGRAISRHDVVAADELGDAIETAHGRNVRTELALAAATARVYPAVKRGLGYAKSCSITRFDDL